MAESTDKKPATKAQTTRATRDEDRDDQDHIERDWDPRTHGPSPAEKAEQGGDF